MEARQYETVSHAPNGSSAIQNFGHGNDIKVRNAIIFDSNTDIWSTPPPCWGGVPYTRTQNSQVTCTADIPNIDRDVLGGVVSFLANCHQVWQAHTDVRFPHIRGETTGRGLKQGLSTQHRRRHALLQGTERQVITLINHLSTSYLQCMYMYTCFYVIYLNNLNITLCY